MQAKKRSLNEIRQTKDSFYVVPKTKKKNMTEKVVKDYFGESNDSIAITKENLNDFISFLNINRYQITRE